MFSVVVPTMWFYEPFVDFLFDVVYHPLVDEIIIIDNNRAKRPETDIFNNPKIKIIDFNTNIGVNPAWNIGVKEAKNEYVCIMNDDVLFDLRVFSKISTYVIDENFGVAGVHPGDKSLDNQIHFRDGQIDIVKLDNQTSTFGFGTLFFINKSKWFDIPNDLKIYYGDDWVKDTQQVYDRDVCLITNIFYSTPSAQTCTKIMDLDERNYLLQTESEIYNISFKEFMDSAYQGYIEKEYEIAKSIKSDINEHIETLRKLSSECESVVEFGVREGWSTRAFLTVNNKLRSYDLVMWPYVKHLFDTMKHIGRDFDYIQANSLEVEIDECDMIFFDTEHTYEQLSKELKLHGNKAKKYLVFHDTISYADALVPAINEFLEVNDYWKAKTHYVNNNGLLVLERQY